MRAQFRSVGGLRTRVLHEGSGEPLLLLHGLGTTADRWVRNIDALAAHHAVHAPDLLGAGFSDDIEFDTPPLQHLAHLSALVDDLGIGSFSVAGSSYGGLLAALLALHLPGRVRSLVIVGSGSALHPPEEQAEVLKAARENAFRALEDGTLEGTRKRMQRIVFDPASVPEISLLVQLTANALPGRARASQQWYEGALRALSVPDSQVFHRLERIAVPTLIITGRNDIRASVAWAENATTRIPDCRLEIFDECGHGPMFEHHERFNLSTRRFLANQGGGGQ